MQSNPGDMHVAYEHEVEQDGGYMFDKVGAQQAHSAHMDTTYDNATFSHKTSTSENYKGENITRRDKYACIYTRVKIHR